MPLPGIVLNVAFYISDDVSYVFQIIFYLWSAHKAPSSKLTVTFKQFSVPKTKSGRLPRHFFPYFWNPCIIHSIQKGSQSVTHYNSSFNSQFQI